MKYEWLWKPLVVAAIIGMFTMWREHVEMRVELHALEQKVEQQRNWLRVISAQSRYYHGDDKALDTAAQP